MADYYAVLKRTLSGFGDAKPQLRQKLYERARSTIESQLKARTPAMSAKKIKEELKSLEEAITKVEAEHETTASDDAQALSLDDIAPVAESKETKDAKGDAGEIKTPEVPSVPQMEQAKEDKDWELPPLDVPSIPLSSDVTSVVSDPASEDGHSPASAPASAMKPDGPPIPISDSPPEDDADLTIPPAQAAEGSSGQRGPALIAGVVAAAVIAVGLLIWTQRDTLGSLFASGESPPKPKPVKTISIKPEPEKPAPEKPGAAEPKPEEPKLEQRLTEEGQEQAPETALNTPETDILVDPQKPLGPVVSQTAILYEEGATPEENTLDSGHVVWSIVQESPAEGQPEEAAIRGRMEVPDRNLVLIMTLKRNADKSLPASHLIELIFAVPDDFSGGAIEEINRFVFKDSEQGRGETLVAVPAPIAPGIFLVALNNAPTAQKKNINLMRTKPWIDIPLQYRTGRRALVTMEKGIPGERVFEEVFAEWDKKDGN